MTARILNRNTTWKLPIEQQFPNTGPTTSLYRILETDEHNMLSRMLKGETIRAFFLDPERGIRATADRKQQTFLHWIVIKSANACLGVFLRFCSQWATEFTDALNVTPLPAVVNHIILQYMGKDGPTLSGLELQSSKKETPFLIAAETWNVQATKILFTYGISTAGWLPRTISLLKEMPSQRKLLTLLEKVQEGVYSSTKAATRLQLAVFL